ncbi:MAG TPA: radical SAM family heme chaperone HemW [Bacteroidota bacterium]|nr:radical SAM family heme chaperone HemW [Bacteroidota bacterium]
MSSLYVHIPFCLRKCVYCDFYSVETVSQMDAFLDALEKEIELGSPPGEGVSFDTLFFGGGTPSLLTPSQLERVMRSLRAAFAIAGDAEITLETNPGTVSLENLRDYRLLGVNRLSIGIQSFDEKELRFLGRIHDAEEAVRCVGLAREAGFANVSVDLIYSLPAQTEAGWDTTLSKALALRPDHVSAYSLIVEDDTPLARMVRAKLVSPNPVESEASLYEHTMAVMERAGFEHYEVSSYARPGFRCRHNSAYWSHAGYLGFGPSAHSFWRPEDGGAPLRWANASALGKYCDSLRKGELPVAMREEVTREQLCNERIFLGLRSTGIDLGSLQREFGLPPDRLALADALVEDGAAALDGGTLSLTSRGYMLCDEIAARFMV